MSQNLLPSNISDAVKRLVASESGVSPSKLTTQKFPQPEVNSNSIIVASTSEVHEDGHTEHSPQLQSKRQRAPYAQYGGRYCCVVGCSNNQGRDGARGITFHRFPREPKRKEQWIQAVRRVDKSSGNLWKPKTYDLICSAHFYGGKKCNIKESPSYSPTIFPTHHVKSKTAADEARFRRHQRFEHSRLQERLSKEEIPAKNDKLLTSDLQPLPTEVFSDNVAIQNENIETSEDVCDSDMSDLVVNLPTVRLKILLEYGVQANFPSKTPAKFSFQTDYVSSVEKATQITSENAAPTKTVCRGTQTKKIPLLPYYAFTDKQFRAFCGVDRNMVQFLLHRTRESTTIMDGRTLKKEDKITLLLAKLKLNVSFSVLAGFFGISDTFATTIFRETLDTVYEEVKNLIIWFDKKTIKARMPSAFKALYPNTRCILDCTEIETEQPPELSQQVLMYSNYKGRFTYKLLIGIAPSGEITFVSRGYGGRCTDTEITVDSEFIDLVEDGDVILGDKGFPHIQAKVAEKGGILVMPPFKKQGRQFSVKENREGYQCASVRVHVERAIRRMKYFKIMKFVPQTLLQHMDKIVVVIAFLQNCFPDLIQEGDDEVSDLAELTERLHT